MQIADRPEGQTTDGNLQGGAKNGAILSHCKYSENSMTENCVEIGELLQNYMLNTVFNFLFNNFIALWRHLAKTQLLKSILLCE